MSSTALAYINPRILKWAREQAGLSLDDAAKTDPSPEKLQKVEAGKEKLTFNQLLKLAKKYGRPPAFFYLNEVPDEAQEKKIQDFRTISINQALKKSKKSSGNLQLMIAHIQEKRDLAIEFQKYDKQYDYNFMKSITIGTDQEIAAQIILQLLNISPTERKQWKNEHEALNGWINAVENLGVFVFQISSIDIEEMRGFSMVEIPYPIIGINRKDSPLARIFTLIHELCHIMLKHDGICTLKAEDENKFALEQFCNRVAGAVLVPMKELIESSMVKSHFDNKVWLEEELNKLRRQFWVSADAILRRLLIGQMTTKEYYNKMHEQWNKEFSKIKGKGGPESISDKILRVNPESFVQIVLSAMENQDITYAQGSKYLDMKLKHLAKLESKLSD